MSSAGDRLVGTFMQPPCRTAVLVRGGGDRPLGGGAELPEACRVFNGSLVDRVEKLSEKLNEIISAKRG
jgi:hypothetical protein